MVRYWGSKRWRACAKKNESERKRNGDQESESERVKPKLTIVWGVTFGWMDGVWTYQLIEGGRDGWSLDESIDGGRERWMDGW
jgi:hypothetical protein